MKIRFKNFLDKKNRRTYYAYATERQSLGYDGDIYLTVNEEQDIKIKLKQLFNSTVFWSSSWEPEYFPPGFLHFIIDDPADEAAFLLWSSEGIES